MRFIFENREAGQNLAEQPRLGKERRFFFPILSLLRLRLATAGQILSLGTALALLGLAVPDAGAQSQPFTTRDSDKDFNTLGLAGQNKNPLGICAVTISNHTYMLVSDNRDKQIFAYDLATKARVDSHHTPDENSEDNDDFELNDANQDPVGIWADNKSSPPILWVVDDEDKKIYSYSLRLEDVPWTPEGKTEITTTNALKGSFRPDNGDNTTKNNQITLDAANDDPTGLWADDTYIYVANNGPDKIFAYKRTLGVGETEANRRAPSKEFDLRDGNTFAQGIWSDGETMWVSDFAGKEEDDDKKIFAYNLATKERDSDKDFDTLKDAGNERPRGIWSDGETMWVADKIDNKIYAYHAFSQFTSENTNQKFDNLASRNIAIQGIWSDGETMWAADDNDTLYAYNLATKTRDSSKESTLKDIDTGLFKSYIWSNGTNIWVSSFDRKTTANRGDDIVGIYAYNMVDMTREESKDFTKTKLINTNLTYKGNDRPRGIWSDGTTMWVAENDDYSGMENTNKIYAYNLTTRDPDPAKDFDTLHDAGNDRPRGIWSDRITMWVADASTNKIFAYNMWTNSPMTGERMFDGARDPDKDFKNLQAAGNNSPRGIWSDGVTMWVADHERDQIFAYRLSDKAVLVELELTWSNLLTRRHESEDFKVQLNPSFLRGTTRYEASIPYSTTNLTLSTKTLRPTDTRSVSLHSKTNLLQDADSTTPGFQINNLAVGANLLSITVVNADTNTASLPRTRTYEVNVNREFFTYNDPTKDMDLKLTSADSTIQGIWANETTIWAVDSGRVYEGQTNQYKKILAYDRKTNLRIESQDFNLNSTNHFAPRGIWSDGTTMWVADSGTTHTNATDDPYKKIVAYKMSDKTRDTTKDFNLDTSNPNPKWIWSDGVTMWVTDGDKNKIFAYKMSNKSRDESKEYDFDANAENITGIWADGATLWVANSEDSKIDAYKLADIDCREEGKDFNTLTLAGNTNPSTIWSDGTTMWVVDSETKKLHAYNQPLSGNASLKSLKLSDVYYLYDEGNAAKLFSDYFSSVTNSYPDAYVIYTNLSPTIIPEAQETNAFIEIQPVDADTDAPGHQVSLSVGDNNPIKIIVTAANGNIKEYTVNIKRENGGRTPHKEFNLAKINPDSLTDDNSNPRGIWSNGTNMWVLDGADRKFYVYKMGNDEYGERNNDKEFALDMDNSAPHGIWSDKTTIWVADSGDNKLYAYDLLTTNRVDSNDFGTLDSANRSPRGIWSDNTIMWVADNVHGSGGYRWLYAYKMTGEDRGGRDISKDIRLNDRDGNTAPGGIWSNSTNMWVLDVLGKKVFAYTSTGVRDTDMDFDDLDEENAHPWGIWSDGTTIWVTDSEDDKLYAYNLPQPPPSDVGDESDESEDSTLRDLRLSGIGLNPTFSPDNTIYTTLVDHDVDSTTVTATPNDSKATVNIFWGGRGTTRITAGKGAQVSLKEGYNVIAVDVTAENEDVQTYLVRVTKSGAPPVSGGPLPQPQSFQPSSTTSSANQADLAGSSIGLGEGKSRLIFAEPLQNGDVRFIFLVPAAEELKIETTPDLLLGEWRPLPEDEFQAERESLGTGQDRLTIILPQAEEKQRFLRLTPQR